VHGFRIIHQARCDDDRYRMSQELAGFLGPDGLVNVLSYLSVGPVMVARPTRPLVKDWDNFVDFVRRVQVPGYEQARQLYGLAEVRERFSDAHEYAPYVQEEIEALLQDYDERPGSSG
jgi:hypothetical protein